MKLSTDIHYVSRHRWRDQRSKAKGQGYNKTKCICFWRRHTARRYRV